MHLSMNPLKQGLKQLDKTEAAASLLHLSMNPLKQGLKQGPVCVHKYPVLPFIHESIKTRVETRG